MNKIRVGVIRRFILPIASAGVLLQAGTCTDEYVGALIASITGSIVVDFVTGALNLPGIGGFSF